MPPSSETHLLLRSDKHVKTEAVFEAEVFAGSGAHLARCRRAIYRQHDVLSVGWKMKLELQWSSL